MTAAYVFRRYTGSRPPTYRVESPSDYLGDVRAVDPGRPGQSRSVNRYLAYPVGSHGHALRRPLGTWRHPGRGPGEASRFEPTEFATRREAADAILDYLTNRAHNQQEAAR